MTDDDLPLNDKSLKFLNGIRALSATWLTVVVMVNYGITIPFG